MLPEIVADVLHFLTRRDLDKTSGVSKWLVAMTAQCCDIFPLRPVSAVTLYSSDSKLNVWVKNDDGRSTDHSFSTLDEAVHFAGAILRYSHTESLQIGNYHPLSTSMTLFPDHLATLIDAIRHGAVRHLQFSCVDLSTLDDDTFHVTLDCRGLQSFEVCWSVVPSGTVTDDLIRASVANDLLRLQLSANRCDAPQRLSDDAVLDFFFGADAASGGESLCLRLDGSAISNMFLKKFFERLQSSASRPSGTLTFCGSTPQQRGLSAYDQYLSSDGTQDGDAAYRFPPTGSDDEYYECVFATYHLAYHHLLRVLL